MIIPARARPDTKASARSRTPDPAAAIAPCREDVADAAQRMISTIRTRLTASRTPSVQSEGSLASVDDLGARDTASPPPSREKLEFV